ncbi:MFS transporter [Rhodococcus rhodochrous]|uniref:MFS transporter n=1 Tax=Rhodococcus sp. IEGM 1366 TaxID=3082223 RepID=UPI00068B7040
MLVLRRMEADVSPEQHGFELDQMRGLVHASPSTDPFSIRAPNLDTTVRTTRCSQRDHRRADLVFVPATPVHNTGGRFDLIGALGLGVGLVSLLLAVSKGADWGLLIVSCICNAGIGLAYGSMPALIMGAVPPSATASANSFNTLMRSVGTSISAAVVGVVLAQMSMDFAGHTLPTEAGFRTGLLIACGAALIAGAIALLIPARKNAAQKETAAESAPLTKV